MSIVIVIVRPGDLAIAKCCGAVYRNESAFPYLKPANTFGNSLNRDTSVPTFSLSCREDSYKHKLSASLVDYLYGHGSKTIETQLLARKVSMSFRARGTRT